MTVALWQIAKLEHRFGPITIFFKINMIFLKRIEHQVCIKVRIKTISIMKLFRTPIILTLLFLSVLMLTNCTEDFEETSFELITNKDVTKVSVSGTVLSAEIDNSQGNGITNEPIPNAIIKVFNEGELIAESQADENGAYSFEFPEDNNGSKQYYIETSKSEYLPNVEQLNTSNSSNQKKYLFKSDDPELHLGYTVDDVTVSGQINYSKPFTIAVQHRRQDALGGWWRSAYFPDGDGRFSITVKRDDVVVLSFSNNYGCENVESSMIIPESFEADIDLGLINDINIPNHLQIDIKNIAKPECLSNDFLYINNDPVTTESVVDYSLCDNIDRLDAFIIDYKNSVISETIELSKSNDLSLTYKECNSYEHSFTLNSTLGNYTQDSDNIEILEHRFRSDVSDALSIEAYSYRLEFLIEDKYLFQFLGRSHFNNEIIFGISKFTDLQKEFSGLSVEGSTTKDLSIEGGFLTGTIEATQEWEEGPTVDFEISIRVPIID